MNLCLKHECAHLLHQDMLKQKENDKLWYQNITPAAALLTTHRIKDIVSASAEQVFKKNVYSLGLFGIYALYNQYNYNQLNIQREREADEFAIRHTDSIKELEEGANSLNKGNLKEQEEKALSMIESEIQKSREKKEYVDFLKAKIKKNLIQLIFSAYKNPVLAPFLNEMFHDHPQIEERVAKMQEKIDFLKAHEAKLEKNN